MVDLRIARRATATILAIALAGLFGTVTAGAAAAADGAPASTAAADAPAEYTYQVGIYIYKKKNLDAPAGWRNSTEQTFCGSKPGSEWFASLPCELPDTVCGPGWAFQQDMIRYTDETTLPDAWPLHVTYPENVHPELRYDDLHGDLSRLTTVPDCTPEPPAPPAPEAGTEVSSSATCDTITTTSRAWTQPYELSGGTYVLGARVYADPVVTTTATTPAALAALGLDEPADCAVVPPVVPTSTPTPTPTPAPTVAAPISEPTVLASTDSPTVTATDDDDDEQKVLAATTDATGVGELAATGFGPESSWLALASVLAAVIGGALLVLERARRRSAARETV